MATSLWLIIKLAINKAGAILSFNCGAHGIMDLIVKIKKEKQMEGKFDYEQNSRETRRKKEAKCM